LAWCVFYFVKIFVSVFFSWHGDSKEIVFCIGGLLYLAIYDI